MGIESTSNRIACSYYEYLLSSKYYVESISEAENIEANNNLIEGHAYLELEKKTMFPINTPEIQKRSKRAVSTAALTTSSSSIITSYTNAQEYKYPLTLNECFPQTPVPQVPMIIPPPIFSQISQFPPPVTSLLPAVPQTFVQEDMINFNVADFINMYVDQFTGFTEESNPPYYIQEIDNTICNNTKDVIISDANNIENQTVNGDVIDQYLALPKQLFPTARMLAIDPNPIINEFCKMPNILQHMPWLLDLEFGIPKSPVTRPIPIYNVKFNSINCKNTPNAIHPGFEMCDPDFKKVLLFYYDYIVSAWYRGYVIANSDRSVENFQSWLLCAMRVLGMCWP